MIPCKASGTCVSIRLSYAKPISCSLQFTTFGTEKDLDEVQVWVGGLSLEQSQLIGRISGNYVGRESEIPLYYSENNMAVIKFHSDRDNQDAGFIIEWTSGWLSADSMLCPVVGR